MTRFGAFNKAGPGDRASREALPGNRMPPAYGKSSVPQSPPVQSSPMTNMARVRLTLILAACFSVGIAALIRYHHSERREEPFMPAKMVHSFSVTIDHTSKDLSYVVLPSALTKDSDAPRPDQ